MKEDWEKAIAFVLKMEGGDAVENDPNDPGGQTKFGISKKAYPNLDVANLVVEQAREIYHRDYWLLCGCDDLPESFAIAVFDCAVNQGTGKAKRLLQIALDMENVDGVIGPKTIAAAAKASPYRIRKFLAERLVDYVRIIIANPKLMVYGVNWMYRVISLSQIVLMEKS